MSTAVACRRSLVLGQSSDLYVLWYVNQPIVAISNTGLDMAAVAALTSTLRYIC